MRILKFAKSNLYHIKMYRTCAGCALTAIHDNVIMEPDTY